MWSLEETSERLALQLLDLLEERECELLIWGFLNSGFSKDEIETSAQEVIDRQDEYVSPSDLIELLEEHRLLFDFRVGDQRLYRTRFAESVRLFFHLRQMFQPDQWAVAPRLVADYRLAIQPRKYPRRHIDRYQVIQRLQAQRKLSTKETEVLNALLAPPGEPKLLLADFQVQATAHLLNTLRGSVRSGIIVCAGTGTGKTLAFYLPCLMRIVDFLKKDVFWTQVIAIYPRNELLTDQFTQAYLQARRLDSVAQQHGGRKIRIGAFFGPTPNRAQINAVKQRRWEEISSGFICPFLHCPKCGKDLVWRRHDIEANHKILVCNDIQCGYEVHDDEVLLTRNQMQETPPDILFTTTEMLNRQMSSSWNRHIFGIGLPRERSPYVMLLDEAHAYNSTHGAQVAMLIRRWRYLLRHRIQFVGLSATLRDAQGFFSQLVGLHPGVVAVVGEGEDLEEEGKEYHLVLRGDPVSGTSLLSTSIQTAMLLGRILDPTDYSPSGDVYGSRLFVFTDDLDVTNRLYHNLQDAEGLDSYGRPRPSKEPLASYRSNIQSALASRFSEGQAWRLCEKIGYDLVPPNNRLRISRTSSQDVGVDNVSKIIVATSSLEVGYNDPTVGAILQHKAPKDSASFIQRRGRAGRKRITRPWTVVVVSDYGRDRLAYQAYEQLFNPILDRPALPTRNRYVLKIQMVHAFMDWMTMQIQGGLRGHVWEDFTEPARNDFQRKRQQIEQKCIQEILTNKEKRDQLSQHLRNALMISEDEIQALLWEPPRALITAVLPTLLRRLSTGWSRIPTSSTDNTEDYRVRFVPMPDFIPENLFSDLSVPEVQIRTPIHGTTESDTWTLPLTQALNTVAPGRVTRRFGVSHILASHWVEPQDLEKPLQDMSFQQLCTQYEDIGIFQVGNGRANSESVLNVRCVRPWVIDMTQTPSNVLATSNAFLEWRSQIYYLCGGVLHDVSPNLLLGDLVQSVVFFTHNMRCPLRVRRFALGSNASIRMRNGEEHSTYIRFVDETTGDQAAVGFEHEVDGILFRCNVSAELRQKVLHNDGIRICRCAYFIHRVSNDTTLRNYGNKFRLEWLAHIYMSLVLEVAMREKINLPDAVEACRLQTNMEHIERVLDTIFQVVDVESQEDSDASGDGDGKRGRVHETIRQLFKKDDVRSRLEELANCLWQEPDTTFQEWLTRRIRATLGGAFLQACHQLVPQYQLGDLYLDIESNPSPPDAEIDSFTGDEIWITESMVGGGGVVEEISRRYAEDPRRFFLLVEMALGLSDFEVVDEELTRIIGLTQSSSEVGRSFSEVRKVVTNEALNIARKSLMQSLTKSSVLLTHSVMTSLNTRILRAGSSPQTDALLYAIIQYWQAEEDRLGVEIDARVFTYLASSSEAFGSQIQQMLQSVGGSNEGLLSSYAVLYAILWPRGSIIRERALESYNPYSTLPVGDPKLIRDELLRREEAIPINDLSWREKANDALTKHGIARIVGNSAQRQSLRSAILELTSQPLESEFLHLYPYVVRIQSTSGIIRVTLHLREALQ